MNVADDDTPTRMLLRAAISQWGYEVIEVSDGEEAWGILTLPDAPLLLILDWLMPKLDGIALCERIKRELKEVPYIILLTQLGGTSNVVKGLEAGADEFLSKPFNMAELRSRLSVGSRIIKYQKRNSSQAKLIQELSTLMYSANQHLTEIISSIEAQENLSKKLQSLDNELKYMLSIITSLAQKEE